MKKDDGALNNLDEYGRKIFIIPAEVKGFFRQRRDLVYGLLVLVFLVIPWIRVHGNQLLLFNIPERKFSIFGHLFLAHDGPLIFFVLALATLGLTLATAIWGRIWCGWACPQTVFIDFIYRNIERWIEGDYKARRRLRSGDLTLMGFFKMLAKWGLFFLVSSIFAHSFLAYFTGSQELLDMIQGSPEENWHYFLFVSCATVGLTFNFGWFREQFCIIMCPYGRFQSVLMDQDSLSIYYDAKRGEPRRGSTGADPLGDCVSCRRCVEVCPTRIDIRDGVQMECIACTACIDACNEVMAKVHKSPNLIRYSSLSGKRRKIFRPRVIAYLGLIFLSLAGFFYCLLNRSPFSAIVIRSKDVPYTQVESQDGPRILNHFMIHLHNQTFEKMSLDIEPIPEWKNLGIELTLANAHLEVKAGAETLAHFFVTIKKNQFAKTGILKSSVQVRSGGESKWIPLVLIGPQE